MPLYSAGFSKLLWPGLREIYGLEYSQYPEEYTNFFNVDTSAKYKEEDQELSGFGLVPTKGTGAPIVFDETTQGLTSTYTHSTYGLGFVVTRELYEDDQYRKIKSFSAALARSVRHTIEILAARTLNEAFSATNYTGADSLELCSAVHTLRGGGTYANELAVSADLDATSFEQAMIDIQNFVDNRGLKIAARPKRLIIPPELEYTAKVLLKSTGSPFDANQGINPAYGAVDYTVCHWLTDSDAWFITTDVPNGLTWFWRRRPEFTEDNDWDSENAKYKTTFRCSQGWTDPRGIFGSPGA